MPSGGKDGGVAVNRFLVQNDVLPGKYRYRLLLTQTVSAIKTSKARYSSSLICSSRTKKSS